MARRDQSFQTIRSEGGLLPPDLLRRVIDPRSKLTGTRPEDYGLPQGERLNEVITQSWNRLRKHWAEFREAAANLPEGEAGTGLTNDKWSGPLLRELGFGLLPTSAGPEVGGRTYAISRFFGSVPVHLVGCGLSLDRRAAGQRGAAAVNPHGLVQEFLNRATGHLWGIVSNGLRLRVLRDNQALSRQSFLEVDLEAMLQGEVYSDFVLLWLMSHATRFAPREGERAETCWLEQWTKEAEDQGTRALGDLRGGVERALLILGEGLTSHPKNATLRDALRSGQFPLADFHGQLLRLVYRLIFLFVAEDRTLDGQPLLHPRDDSDIGRTARERYSTHYSTARLRELAAKIKGSRHGDLWRQFQLLVGALSGDAASAGIRLHLALPALGSLLWNPDATTALNNAELTNHDFLEALRHLAFTRQGRVLRPVDYKNLGAEELGGVYEGLLALTPQLSADGARFTFAEFAGNERKSSGSYYTPDSLVQCLLDSALDPVVDEAIKGKTGAVAEQAILSLKVCDPAVGSGHFLVGAAHRLARHLARVRALAQGESEPSPLLYQHALRDVIGRCLYGVDLNPMAAELCRVSLWLEALEPGKPLSFLDHHIRVGNSLLGATPELIAAGLPDDAFTAIEGDEKKACATLKKRNQQERIGQKDMLHLMVAEPEADYNSITARTRGIDQAPDDTITNVHRKAAQFQGLTVSPEYQHCHQLADTWCAAFVWKKNSKNLVDPITTDAIRRLERDASALAPMQHHEVERLSKQYHYFHWHLAFPEVFAKKGFDCVIGNPPWDQLQIDPREFFAPISPEIALAETTAKRNALIAGLKNENPVLHTAWLEELRAFEGTQVIVHGSGRYPLSSVGRLNSAPLFTELSLHLLAPNGRMGLVVPSGISTDSFCQHLFARMVDSGALVSMFDFENRAGLFPDVDSRMKFSLLTCGNLSISSDRVAEFVFFAHQVEELRSPEKRFSLRPADIALLNPNTKTSSIFRTATDAELTKAIYRRVPVLKRDAPEADTDSWGFVSRLLIMSNTDSNLFETRNSLTERGFKQVGPILKMGSTYYLPLYEAKMFQLFDHRASDVIISRKALKRQAQPSDISAFEHCDPERYAIPRFWINAEFANDSFANYKRGWYIAVTKVTSATNARTFIATLLPRFPSSDSSFAMLLTSPNATPTVAAAFCANVSSFVFDYIARQKLGGVNMLSFIQKQLPTLPPQSYLRRCAWAGSTQILTDWLLIRMLELTYTAWDLESFAQDCSWSGPPFRWDEERRFLLRCELDAAFFHLYLPVDASGDWHWAEGETAEGQARLKKSFPIPRDAVAYIMDTFPIVRRKDEGNYSGDYRTKRVILEIYDAMHEAIRTGKPYQTRLDPLPGPPTDASGKFVDYAAIASNPPPHIHLPREHSGAGGELHLADLSREFPRTPFVVRLGTGSTAGRVRVTPVPTKGLVAGDQVIISTPSMRLHGASVPAAIGKLGIESRTEAATGEHYMLISVRSDSGLAQARFAEEEWKSLLSIGRVEILT
jgi:hypothetical protein